MYAKVASRSDYSVKPAPLPNIHSEPPYLVARSRHTWLPEAAAGASPCGSSGVAGASPCGSTGAAGAASVGSKSTKGLVKTPSNNVLVMQCFLCVFLAKKKLCVQNPWNPGPKIHIRTPLNVCKAMRPFVFYTAMAVLGSRPGVPRGRLCLLKSV